MVHETNGSDLGKPFYGPLLRFAGFKPEDNSWNVSALVICSSTHNQTGAPSVTVNGSKSSRGEVIDTFHTWNFWRFSFSVPLTEEEQTHEYRFTFGPPLVGLKSYSLTSPGLGKQLHWGFKSCDWFSGGVSAEERESMGGYKPLWEDLWQKHTSKPLHFLIGGGDQLYCDPVFTEIPDLVSWSKFSGLREMKKAMEVQMDNNLKATVATWYFNHYCKSFSLDVVADVMASVPQMLMWDDHDIFDGWGSYPKHLHSCHIFQGIFAIAERFFLLFQQHTTSKLASQHGYFGGKSYHFLNMTSPEMALLGMDMRSNRTLEHIISKDDYKALFDNMYQLPATVKHLVVISTVPVVYPEVPFSEMSLKMIGFWQKHSWLWACIKKTQGKKKGGSGFLKFDQPELLDDLIDHWSSSVHIKERNAMIGMFQEFAKNRGVRVSFISGDVHLASVGLLYSQPKIEDTKVDHRWMLNVTSSAIVNVPPPGGLVTAMTSTNRSALVDKHTREKMVRVFKGTSSPSDKLMARRNWCDVVLQPASASGEMGFQLRLEGTGDQKIVEVDIAAPPLNIQPTLQPGVKPDFKNPHHRFTG